MTNAEKIIIALDFSNEKDAVGLAEKLSGTGVKFKVGMELYYSCGPKIIESLHDFGDIFLDLKLHDIPQTMAKAARSLANLGVWMTNVHASAGKESLQAVREAVPHGSMKLIGVTALTSLTDMNHIAPGRDLNEIVADLYELCQETQLDGIVCSALDIPKLPKPQQSFDFVTPGIRLDDDSNDDQKRIMTPKAALDNGSSYLVIGRSITQSKDPQLALEKILRSM